MKSFLAVFAAVATLSLSASAAFAGLGGPAPVIGDNFPGIALLMALGIGYAIFVFRRRNRKN